MSIVPKPAGLALAMVLGAFLALAQAAVGNPADPQRLWLKELAAHEDHGVTVKVTFPKEQALPGTLVFACLLDSFEPEDNVNGTLTVLTESGEPVYRGQVTLNLAHGKNECRFTWSPSDLADGVYTIRVEIGWTSKHVLASREFEALVLSDVAVRNRLDQVAAAVAALHERLQQVKGFEHRFPYATLCWRSAEFFVPKARASFESGDWPRANDMAVYLLKSIARTRVQLALGGFNHEHIAPMPEVVPDQVGIADGSFDVRGRPIFFFGAYADHTFADRLPELHEYGVNMAVYPLTSDMTLANSKQKESFRPAVDAFFAAADSNRIAVAVRLAAQQLPEWAFSKWPALREHSGGSFPYDVMLPQARTLLERHIHEATRAVAGRPNLASVILADNPEFRITGDAVLEGFIAACRESYHDYEKLNRIWRTRYLNFDEIELKWDYDRPPYQYDLQTYHQKLGMAFLDWLASDAHDVSAGVPVQVSCADNVLEKDESKGGVDREVVAHHMVINGCTTMGDVDRGGEFDPAQPGMYYTLLRSFNPRAPVFDSECGALTRHALTGSAAFRRVYALAWDSLISGLSACAAPLDGPDGILQDPGVLEAYGMASLDANRLAPIVKQFQNTPAPLAILWSKSSKIYKGGDPYLASITGAYRGCATFGYKVRFISESECAAGDLTSVRILVIPAALAVSDDAFNAIDHYIKSGGVTLRSGDPIPYDALGNSRSDVLSTSPRTVLLRGGMLASVFLAAVDAANDLLGDRALPHAVNQYGYPLEEVKTQFAMADGIPYLFLLSVREKPVNVTLSGPYSSGRDVIGCEDIVFPYAVSPFRPMLIRLDAPSNPNIKTAVTPKLRPQAGGPATGVVEPIGPTKPEGKESRSHAGK